MRIYFVCQFSAVVPSFTSYSKFLWLVYNPLQTLVYSKNTDTMISIAIALVV